MPIKVLIVDDQVVVCEGLRAILGLAPDMEVVGTAYDGEQALQAVAALKPDLVLMDLKMPVMNGIAATRAIGEQYPAVRVLVLTTFDADEWVFDAIRAGAAGYLLKDSRREAMLNGIRDVMAGRAPVDPAVAGKLLASVRGQQKPDSSMLTSLNDREKQVLRLLAHGHSTSDIADRLSLTPGTVRNYVSAILAKLDVPDRIQAVALAWRYGLIKTEE